MPRDLESYRDGIDVGREQMRAEVERLTVSLQSAIKSENELRAENARLQAHAKSMIDAMNAENTRLRALLRAVVQEADRETNAFIAARAELGGEP